MAHRWSDEKVVVEDYNAYSGTKLLLKDDGKIVAAYGETENVIVLLGFAYYNGWIQPGWYHTGEINVVAVSYDYEGKATYEQAQYSSMYDAGYRYDSIYITEDGINGKAIINENSVVTESTRNAGLLPVGYYFLQFTPNMNSVEAQ